MEPGRPVIIGGGVAGLLVALHMAPQPVILLSKAPLGAESSSGWAQGGVAAAVGPDDSPALHLADTLAAGNGLVDADVARRIVEAAPAAIEDLRRFGVRFDTKPDGSLLLGREAAHGRNRIVHAGGDATGREMMRALVAAALATPSITVLGGCEARRLLMQDGSVAGVVAVNGSEATLLQTDRVVIATGGAGGLFLHTTNPAGSFGQGLALAARAGADLVDLEFVQFHPTALATEADPLALISEAVRGEGAVLVDERGERFMAGTPGAELAPRDVVARAVWRHRADGHAVFLDARQALGPRFAQRFPSIAARCAEAGIDPGAEPIPVVPAAHYHMGGIAVDAAGRSSVPGLWAAGEAACTGLHGANRLASNSLLEAVVCARGVADDVAGRSPSSSRTVRAFVVPPRADPTAVRAVVSRGLGLLRDEATLRAALAELCPLATGSGPEADPAAVGLMLAVAALHRRESRGAHFRNDAPQEEGAWARRVVWRLDDALAFARACEATVPFARRA